MRNIEVTEPSKHILITELIDGETHRIAIACGDITSAVENNVEDEANNAWSSEDTARFTEQLQAQAQNNVPSGLDELKQFALLQIRERATDVRARVAEHADAYKLAGWNNKYQRALRMIASEASDADRTILQIECDKRGKNETIEELAQKQAAKGQALATSVAIIDGLESSASEAVEAKRSENTLVALVDDMQTQLNQHLEQLLGG